MMRVSFLRVKWKEGLPHTVTVQVQLVDTEVAFLVLIQLVLPQIVIAQVSLAMAEVAFLVLLQLVLSSQTAIAQVRLVGMGVAFLGLVRMDMPRTVTAQVPFIR